MVESVGEDVVVLAEQGGDGAQVGLVAGGEAKRGRPADEIGQVRLQFLVQRERAVQVA